jgi:hypothetical protein
MSWTTFHDGSDRPWSMAERPLGGYRLARLSSTTGAGIPLRIVLEAEVFRRSLDCHAIVYTSATAGSAGRDRA